MQIRERLPKPPDWWKHSSEGSRRRIARCNRPREGKESQRMIASKAEDWCRNQQGFVWQPARHAEYACDLLRDAVALAKRRCFCKPRIGADTAALLPSRAIAAKAARMTFAPCLPMRKWHKGACQAHHNRKQQRPAFHQPNDTLFQPKKSSTPIRLVHPIKITRGFLSSLCSCDKNKRPSQSLPPLPDARR